MYINAFYMLLKVGDGWLAPLLRAAAFPALLYSPRSPCSLPLPTPFRSPAFQSCEVSHESCEGVHVSCEVFSPRMSRVLTRVRMRDEIGQKTSHD